MITYKISREAHRDIQKIWLYTLETWSRKQADRYFDLILNEIEFLARNPETGKDYGFLRKGYFRAQVKSHYIFYKINKRKKEIEIIRILHQIMDIESKFD